MESHTWWNGSTQDCKSTSLGAEIHAADTLLLNLSSLVGELLSASSPLAPLLDALWIHASLAALL